MATVLCTGVHEGLTSTRKLVLESAGHTVVTAMSADAIISFCHAFKFDVATIGQSGDTKTKQEWAGLIRQHSPATKILEIYVPHCGNSVTSADSLLESPAIPRKLSACIEAMSVDGAKNNFPEVA